MNALRKSEVHPVRFSPQYRRKPVPRPAKQPQPLRVVKTKSKKQINIAKPVTSEYIHIKAHKYRLSLSLIFTIALIFAGGVGTAFSFAYLQHMRFELSRTRTEIAAQQEENIRTRSEIARHLNVEEISEIAQNRLNMAPPYISQIVNISVNHQSYVVQSAFNANSPANAPANIWQTAWQYIRSLLE